LGVAREKKIEKNLGLKNHPEQAGQTPGNQLKITLNDF
jgi:hypothetical protein